MRIIGKLVGNPQLVILPEITKSLNEHNNISNIDLFKFKIYDTLFLIHDSTQLQVCHKKSIPLDTVIHNSRVFLFHALVTGGQCVEQENFTVMYYCASRTTITF